MKGGGRWLVARWAKAHSLRAMTCAMHGDPSCGVRVLACGAMSPSTGTMAHYSGAMMLERRSIECEGPWGDGGFRINSDCAFTLGAMPSPFGRESGCRRGGLLFFVFFQR
jgi:hypothetical protein